MSSELRKFLRDLTIWAAAAGSELILRRILDLYGSDLGFDEAWISASHTVMSIGLWMTLMSTIVFTATEVVSIGLRRLLRELTLLVRQFRGFLAAFRRRKAK